MDLSLTGLIPGARRFPEKKEPEEAFEDPAILDALLGLTPTPAAAPQPASKKRVAEPKVYTDWTPELQNKLLELWREARAPLKIAARLNSEFHTCLTAQDVRDAVKKDSPSTKRKRRIIESWDPMVLATISRLRKKGKSMAEIADTLNRDCKTTCFTTAAVRNALAVLAQK